MAKINDIKVTQQQVSCVGGLVYTIRSGDTLYLLAQRYGTTVDRITAANPGINPNNLQIGQQICIPGVVNPPSTCNGFLYTIRSGDTVYTIAQSFNTTVDRILAANPGINVNNLQVGQQICIPSYSTTCNGFFYTIRSGDTLYTIAQRYGTTVDRLLAANPGINANNLQIGQQICIPGVVPPPTCNGTLYIVRAGDTLYSIAQMFGTTVERILTANPGLTVNNLQIGQQICIPRTTPTCNGVLYTVRAGDTLYTIAQMYGTTVERILAANPGLTVNNLQIGQQICIPRATSPCNGILYTVRAGDTLYTIAQMYGTTVERILAANPGLSVNNLQIGQQICIPSFTPVCNGIRYTVKAGDTAYLIARAYGISLTALMNANPNVDLSTLYVGQVLCIPVNTNIVRTCTFALNAVATSLAPDAGGVLWLRYDSNGRTEIVMAISNVPDPLVLGANNYSAIFTWGGLTYTLPLTQVVGQTGLWAGTGVATFPTSFFTSGRVDVSPGPILTGNISNCK